MTLKLKAKTREILGKKVINLRRKGIIPAIIYGHNFNSIPLEINLKEFLKIFVETGETTIIEIELEKGKTESVIIHDIMRNPVSDEILHIDFYRIKKGEAMTVEIPLIFEGVAPVIKDMGGILVTTTKNIKIKALPKNLPHDIKVDISSLSSFEDQIFIADLPKLEGVEYLADEKDVIVSISEPRSKEELDSLSEEVAESVEDVEGVADQQGDETSTESASEKAKTEED